MAQAYSINTGLTALPEIDQKKDPQTYVECLRLRQGINLVMQTLDTYTGAIPLDSQAAAVTPHAETTRLQNLSKIYVPAGATLTPGAYVYLHNVAGVLTADLASTPTNLAWGWVSSISTVVAGATAEVSFYGVNSELSGLTLAAKYYLTATPGVISTVVSAQFIGRALSATELLSSPL